MLFTLSFVHLLVRLLRQYRSSGWSVGRSVSRSIGRSGNRLIGRSFRRSVGRSLDVCYVEDAQRYDTTTDGRTDGARLWHSRFAIVLWLPYFARVLLVCWYALVVLQLL